jgi:predicted SnoaL-like aldol condensation-catalyzing enzyme
MMQTDQTKEIVKGFIENIWNRQQLDKLSTYLHPDYQDHSLPAVMGSGQIGLAQWITATSNSFQHQTIIEHQVAEDDKCVVKIRMEMIHTGIWRGIEPTGLTVNTQGFRLFRVSEGKIIEHWAEINGTSLESKLRAGIMRDTKF